MDNTPRLQGQYLLRGNSERNAGGEQAWPAEHSMEPRRRLSSRGRQTRDIDAVVGLRIRMIRELRQLSQGELGAAIGVTFQQVQKYEAGMNRVAVSTLVDIAHALRVSAALLLEGVESGHAPCTVAWKRLPREEQLLVLEAYAEISEADIRRHVLNLLQSIADHSHGEVRGSLENVVRSIRPGSRTLPRSA